MSMLDYEAIHYPHFVLTVQVADNGAPSLHFNKTFIITITDINEPPKNITISSNTVLETAKVGQVIGKLDATNPEVNQTVIFAVQLTEDHPTDAKFSVMMNETGSYVFLSQKPQNDWLGSYEIDLNVTDTGSPPPLVFASIRIYTIFADPCSTGALKCDVNANCSRYNSTYGVCHCKNGYTESGAGCKQRDNCKVSSRDQEVSTTFGASVPALTPTSVCVGNSTCINGVNNFFCNCSRCYTGIFCEIEIDLCAIQPEPICLNGGSYYSMLGTPKCMCPAGFYGLSCEINQNDCSPNPCTRGKCVDGVDAYTCQCPEGYTGKDCSYRTDACVDSDCSDTQICVPMAQTTESGAENGDSVAITCITPGEGNLQPLTPDKYSCAPKAYTALSFFNNATINTKLRDSWRNLIKLTLYLDPDDGEGMIHPDEVYLIPEVVEGNGLGFVVLAGSKVMPPGIVLAAVDKTCENATYLPKLKSLCASRKVTAQLLPEDREPSPIEFPKKCLSRKPMPKSSTSDATWLIVAAVVVSALILIAIIMARFTQVKHKRIKQWQRLHNKVDADGKDAVSECYKDDLEIDEHKSIDNPLYSNPQAMFGDRVQTPALSCSNPLYEALHTAEDDTPARAREVEGAEEPLYNELIYDMLGRGSSTDMWREAEIKMGLPGMISPGTGGE